VHPPTKIAVTGASGFLGRHLLAALSNGDAEIVAHVRTAKTVFDGSTRQVAFDLAAPPNDAFDRLGRPDIVIHLAWDGLPNYTSPRHVEVELPAQLRFLRGLVAAGLKRLVVVGTCFEYGLQSGCLHEDMPPLPSTSYGQAKDALRRQLEALSDAAPFDLRWLRLFYLYGNGQAPSSLYSLFHAAIARGDRTFDMSRGDQLRDYMRVEDAAAALVVVARADTAPRIVNICSGEPISVRNLVERWRADQRADIALNLGALGVPAYEPFAFWGDKGRLAALWSPSGITRA
jgi:dTDP-6-deoxy-L-talose 4-dehydrogenase (NAD+)